MFGLEVYEIRSIFPKILGLFVVDQLHAVDILQVGRLCLERLLLLGVQLLPSVTDQTSYLGEGQIFMFDFFANPVREQDVCGRGLFGRVFIGLRMSPVLPLVLRACGSHTISARAVLDRPVVHLEILRCAAIVHKGAQRPFSRDASTFRNRPL